MGNKSSKIIDKEMLEEDAVINIHTTALLKFMPVAKTNNSVFYVNAEANRGTFGNYLHFPIKNDMNTNAVNVQATERYYYYVPSQRNDQNTVYFVDGR